MERLSFPPLSLAEWRPTRDTLHVYSQIIGKIRRALTPPQRHWWHASLKVVPDGISTTAVPIPNRDGATFEMRLELLAHRLETRSSRGDRWVMPLSGQPAREFMQACLAELAAWEINPEFDQSLFDDSSPRVYEPSAVETFWQALSAVDTVLKHFKAELPGKSSPVQLWPHNFDLALTWFSGRKVPGMDPADEENADEQMGFGFSTGDARIPEAYLYATAYPWPEGLEAQPLPGGASWHTEGWKGGLLKYRELSRAEEPEAKLLRFLREVFQARSRLAG